MHHHIRSEIEIEAPPEAVWTHLTDLTSYADWNPFITAAEGTPAVGERLKLRMQPPGGRAMTMRPTVTAAEPTRVFEWLGRLGMKGLFDGHHRFELTPTATGTHLIQSEQFSGVLVRMLRGMLDGPTLSGFEAMNEAHAARATSSSQAS